MKKQTIYFDMDGTIANFYGVEGWLDYLTQHNPAPYKQAEPLVNMSHLAKLLHKAQKKGYEVGIVSWLSKNSTEEYDKAVTEAKLGWLNKHLPSVEFNEIKIVKYGTPKSTVVDNPFSILFDDEEPNRNEWKGQAYDQTEIINTLKALV